MDTAADDLWSLDNEVLPDVYRCKETALRKMWFELVEMTAEIDHRGLASTHGATSTASFLRDLVELSPREATARVTAAAALVGGQSISGEPTEPIAPRTADAARE